MTNSGRHPLNDYDEPVRRLLSVGEVAYDDPPEWRDYPAEFGLGLDHVDSLIRMVLDPALNGGGSETTEVWAPLHAWRALGQLRAEAAVGPLLSFLTSVDDAVADREIPEVFGLIGPAALIPIAAFLSDRKHRRRSLGAVTEGITKMAQCHPACRGECIDILVRMLRPGAGTDPTNCGFAINALLDLSATEAIDAIREAFAQDRVELAMAGDLEDVEIELGLRETRETPKPFYQILPDDWPLGGARHPDAQALPRPVKVGRNGPCPCGSGKKYKKCCLQ